MASDGNEVRDLNPSLNCGAPTTCVALSAWLIKTTAVGSAKSRLMRGRKTLRSYLKRYGVSNSRVY
jgi:hypothetical protein